MRAAFVLLIGLVALAAELGLEVILGAFIAGAVISLVDRDRAMTHRDFRRKLEAAGLGIFIPVFFVTTGLRYDLGQPGLLANDLLQLFTARYAASKVVGLHTTEEMWFDRPVLLGERVRLSARYVDKYVHRGQGSVVMEAEARDGEGNVLVRHRGVEIMRTRPGEVGGRGSAGGGEGRRVTGDYDDALPFVERLGGSVVPGMGLLPISKDVTFEQMAVFSRIGEFVRNIHNDLETARAADLDVPILQGQQQFCYLAQLYARVFGPTGSPAAG